jgi:hypothetical protein
MYYNEPSQAIKLDHIKNVLGLELNGTEHDFALLKLQSPIKKAQYFQLFPSLKDKLKLTVTGFINTSGS